MDSLTQILLGASVAELVIGRAIGRKASLYGAMLGTLPDLDVLIPFGGAIEDFTYHRGFSHSLLVLTAAAPAIGWALHRLHGLASLKLWIFMVWLVLITHPLLDAFTAYGTQLFWPITEYPVSGSSTFIIDPAFTLWLAIGVIAALAFNRQNRVGHRVNTVCLALAGTYLAWTMAAKAHVTDIAERSIEKQGLTHNHLLSTPAPFNTLLWRFVAMQDDGYYVGYYSLFDETKDIQFTRYESRTYLLEPLADNWYVKRLQWFSHGFFRVSQPSPSEVVITDLRMGVENAYVFSFKIADIAADGGMKPANERIPVKRVTSRLWLFWDRIWDSSVILAPK